MNARNCLYVLAALFATVAMAADNSGSVSGSVNGAQIGKKDPRDDKVQPPPHATCMSQCAANEQRCSREVRRARTDCQRVAANGGRDVFTGRQSGTYNGSANRHEGDNGIDYRAFCSYFANPDASCGPGYYNRSCQQRLSYRHGICLNAMNNIASLRYDCFRTERDASNQCREDLRDCNTACQ
jgi:hypothetical protein